MHRLSVAISVYRRVLLLVLIHIWKYLVLKTNEIQSFDKDTESYLYTKSTRTMAFNKMQFMD